MATTHIITSSNTVVQADGNILSDMDGEKVMLSIKKGKYYNLGKIGGCIWEDLQQPIKVSHLIDNLLLKYEVERSSCENQVLTFLNSLFEENLINIITTPLQKVEII